MDNPYFSHRILNSPYHYPARHWELGKDGQPTQEIIARPFDKPASGRIAVKVINHLGDAVMQVVKVK